MAPPLPCRSAYQTIWYGGYCWHAYLSVRWNCRNTPFSIQVGAILGRSGCVVKEIMSLSGTQIQVKSTSSDRSVTVYERHQWWLSVYICCLYFHCCRHSGFFLKRPLYSNTKISQKDGTQGSGDKYRQVKVVGLQHQVRVVTAAVHLIILYN